ncbi:MAG: cupin domain-containing protein [Chloroflexota bacterium]|nr:cupin domain-containing protein [Chloroflexota bacterium]
MHRTRTIQIVGLAAVCSLGRSTTLARIPAGSSTGTFPPHRPGVYKHVTVMTGSLACCLGETSIDLAAGDSISFPAEVAHTFHNPGDELAQYFLVIDSSRGASGANRGDRSQ